MADLKYYDIIDKPLLTEKSMDMMADRKYAFYVHKDATKTQVKDAVEKMFEGTKVESVNTMNVKGKKRRTRQYKYGMTRDRKKAIVTVTPDSKEIEIFEGM
jgi:large subunit ribosomal protein L23